MADESHCKPTGGTTPHEASPPSATADRALRKARKLLNSIGPVTGEAESKFESWVIAVANAHLAASPQLVFYIAEKLLGIELYGPWEKMRAGFRADFQGVPFGFEWRKFGLRILYPTGDGVPDGFANRVQAVFSAAIAALRPMLQEDAKEQVDLGNVTIENSFPSMRARYEYLRAVALEKYEEPPPPPEVHFDEDGNETSTTYSPFQSEAHGSAIASGMIGEYFSMMEHLFLIALPFVRFEPSGGALLEFHSSNWGTKFRRVIDLDSDPVAKALYDELKHVREHLRNPMAHGGLRSGASSFHFHLTGQGATPFELDRSPRPTWPPIRVRRSRFDEICDLFDRTDKLFAEHPVLQYAWLYASSGLPVAFDPENRRRYVDAATSPDEFEEFLDGLGRWIDDLDNMDF